MIKKAKRITETDLLIMEENCHLARVLNGAAFYQPNPIVDIVYEKLRALENPKVVIMNHKNYRDVYTYINDRAHVAGEPRYHFDGIELLICNHIADDDIRVY